MLIIQQVPAQEGIRPIPATELYGQKFNKTFQEVPECKNPGVFKYSQDYMKCWRASEYHKDYGCRYHTRLRPLCHCCGAYYHYIEQGPVCTKFCLNEDSAPDTRKYGLDKIIITLPFNWGWDVPDRITLEDGTEVDVPCDVLDGNNYGCGDKDSDGFRDREKNIDKLETPRRRRTTTIQPAYNYNTKNTKTTSRTRNSNLRTLRTTTQRTWRRKKTNTISTIPTGGKLVPFSLTSYPKIGKNNATPNKPRTARKTTKTTTRSFGEKLRRTTTEYENVWSSNKKTEEERKTPKLVDDRPVWG